MNLEEYFSTRNLEKTQSIPGTYFEQKITPDILSFAAQCILDFTGGDISKSFSDPELRGLDFYKMILKDYLSKPDDTKDTNNEYNKLIRYQIDFLVFGGVLEEVAQRPKRYKIKNLEILNYVALHERQALLYIQAYIEKFLIDNNLGNLFDSYRKNPTQRNYEKTKESFYLWAKDNTNVKTDDKRHTFRVFNKIFNFYTHKHSLPGQYLARVKDGPNPYLNLIYNRINFRDKNKAKNVSRNDFAKTYDPSNDDSGYISYLIGKAKKEIRQRYPTTEIVGFENYPSEGGDIVQIHHIFPAASFQEFASSKENLISITPGQHNTHAHAGNTHYVDPNFQLICLQVRLDEIEKSIQNKDEFFNLDTFISMLNHCLDLNIEKSSNIDTIRKKLRK